MLLDIDIRKTLVSHARKFTLQVRFSSSSARIVILGPSGSGKSLTLKGYLYSEIVSDDAALDRAKAFIVAGLESGALKPRIARTFPLDAIQDAHRFLESNDQIGKVVVTV